MTEWTTHMPAFDGDAPEGVTIGTHIIQCEVRADLWEDCKGKVYWSDYMLYRHLPRNPPAAYDQVKAYCEHHGFPVPPKPVDYEAWRPVLVDFAIEQGLGSRANSLEDGADMTEVEKLTVRSIISALRVAMTIPACMDVIRE